MKITKDRQGMLGRPTWRGAAPSLGIAPRVAAPVVAPEPPATKGSDMAALWLGGTREFGAPTVDIDEARKRVWASAGGYALPAPVTTRALAIAAFMLLMRKAREETPSNAAFFRRSENEAAYNFRASSVDHILRSAVDYTRSAPDTQAIAKKITYKPAKVSVAADPTGIKAAAKRVVEVFTPPASEPPAPADAAALSWYDSIPTWVPWAAGGVLLLGTTALVLRRGSQ